MRLSHGAYEGFTEVVMDSILISVVILTKNAGPAFRETLDQIYAQQLNGVFELVIVDSGSTDGTVEMIKQYPARLYTIRSDEFNFGRTRDYGFSLARGEFIVTISQDVVPCDETWLQQLTIPFKGNERIAAVQGAIKFPMHKDIFYWEKAEKFYFTSDVRRWSRQYKDGLSFVNCAIRRSFWLNHRLGSAPFSEDKKFQISIHKAGFELVVARSALCYHGHQYSMKSLMTRLIGEGRGWKHAGLSYGFVDCIHDIFANKWMLRKGIQEYLKYKTRTPQEILFPIIRPVCIYLGNRAKAD